MLANGWKVVRTYVRNRYHLVLWSAWIVLFIEFLSRRNLADTLSWALLQIHAFLLNTCLICAVLLLLTAVTGRARPSVWALAGMTAVLAFISGVKLEMLGLPLVPWDFVLASEAQGWVGVRDVLDLSILLGSAAFLSVGYLLVHRLKGLVDQYPRNERIALTVTALLAVALFYYGAPVEALFHLQSTPWDQARNVRGNGFSMALVFNVRELAETRGEDLDAAALAALSDQVSLPEAEPDAVGPDAPAKPNIIMVLSESFWDPARMDGVTFSQDPIPFLRGLQKQYPSGWMLSPEFAGSTANVEFEILTGLSMQMLPDGVLVYSQFMDRPIDSLASILARQGYESTMISPWAHDFYNSNKAYESFGFHKFVSQEFIRPVYSGPYIADSEVARVIVDVSAQSDGPDFILANTAENHYGYTPEKFDENTIRVTGLAGTSKDLLETYAQGCLNADRMLRTLVEHYGHLEEPTILVFFGDHLPLLGTDYSVYKEAGYITGIADPDFLEKMYQVPVLVWSNYLPAKAETIYMGTNFLGPYILEMARVEGTPITRYFTDLYRKVPAIPPQNRWAEMGVQPEELKEYEALQRDIMFGDQRVYGDLKERIADPAFMLGYGPMTIHRASYSADNGEPVLTVTGENLAPTAQVVLDGEPVPTTWVDYGQLTVQVPPALAEETLTLAEGDEVTVEVEVRNLKKGTTVSKSNTVVMTADR